jgi:hypothetical protein
LRGLVVVVLVVVVILAAVGIFLVVTTPKSGGGMRYPLTDDEQTLLTYVPSDADSFAILPTAALAYAKLDANPLTHRPLAAWSEEHGLPSAWMLGRADFVVWKSGERTSYAIRIDPIRATIVRIYLMMAADSGMNFRLNAASESPIPADERTRLAQLAAELPAGDIFTVQREAARGAFPPIGRPAVSSMRIDPDDILVTARAAADPDDVADAAPPVTPRFGSAPLLTAWFARPPRQIEDLNRLLGAKVTTLIADGGSVALFDVDTRKVLLPRPRGVFILPADDARRQAVGSLQSLAPETLREALGFTLETAEQGSDLLVAFDETSIPLYLKDAPQPSPWPANRWALRLDPARIVPVLEQLGKNTGLRLAAPKLYRSARDLGQWIGYLRDARSVEAADSVRGAGEELQVRIRAK